MKKKSYFRFEIEYFRTEGKYCLRVYENGVCQHAPRFEQMCEALMYIDQIVAGAYDDITNKDSITIKLLRL